MKKKILVYDNQLGYYNLLKENFKKGFTFLLFNSEYDARKHDEDAVVFFMHDRIEMLDLIKIYHDDVPFIIGCAAAKADCLVENENIYSISLLQIKRKIVKQLSLILDTITNNNLKEEAL